VLVKVRHDTIYNLELDEVLYWF